VDKNYHNRILVFNFFAAASSSVPFQPFALDEAVDGLRNVEVLVQF
jgi:hypothetical protein